MTIETTLMRKEILEIPSVTRELLGSGRAAIAAAAKGISDADPWLVATVARGSSDHVAKYLKYACELSLGVPVASIGPSVASIYGAELKLGNAACIAISQSGKSPDIVSLAASATARNAVSVAITNDAASPLAGACRSVVPICAGVEASVAATKTFVTSAVAGLAVVAEWSGDARLAAAIEALPGCFEEAVGIDWPELREFLRERSSLYVLGRGPSLAISNEAALKFKETCQIHAESYSSAEVMHGPVSIVEEGYPVLAFTARDAAEAAVVSVADRLAGQGAAAFVTSDRARAARRLEFAATGHALTDPLALIVSFYAFIEKLAADRGINPDTPRHLRKVTETV
ncbi:MAG: SIS domain-containing protein [Paracoccaceae bacterium]